MGLFGLSNMRVSVRQGNQKGKEEIKLRENKYISWT